MFLFDEPLSNLDAKQRVAMRTGIKLLHDRLKATIDYVTHDPAGAGDALRPWRGKIVILGIRPEQISDAGTVQGTAHNAYARKCRIELVEPTGADTLLFVRINVETVCWRVRPEQDCAAGTLMELAFDLAKALFFNPDNGKRIG